MMNVKIISWNVRGLNCRDKRRIINSVFQEWKADVICLQETKLEGENGEAIRQVWGSRGVKYAQLEASGTRGGILMLWDSKHWEGKVVEIGVYTLTCGFKSRNCDFEWHMHLIAILKDKKFGGKLGLLGVYFLDPGS